MQKELWEKEYRERKDLPSSRTMKPSKAIEWFFDTFAKEQETGQPLALDMGAGQGRNSIRLAEVGYEVVGVEMVGEALAVAHNEAQKAGVAGRVRFIEQSVGDELPLEDESFDLIVDMMTLHLLDSQERAVYAQEVIRLLKPGGRYLFYTICADSPAVEALCESSPGPEPNSYIIPQSGMTEKAFTEEELREMFAPLEVVHLEAETTFTPAFGDVYERVYYLGLMEKPELR